jgi:CRP-like cAMP-binding protein/predicted MFS family arabinose efflux permease
VAEQRSGVFRRALRYRDFRLLMGGFAISITGAMLYNVALVVYVFDTTRSAALVSVALIVRLVPAMVLSTVGGVIADRFERRAVLIACDVLYGVLMLAMAAGMLLGVPVWLIIVIAGVTTAVGTPTEPAAAAFTPAMVEEDDLAAANAAREGVANLATLAGPAAAGVLLAVTVPGVAILLNGVAAFGSALMNLAIRSRSRAQQVEAQTLWEQLTGGFHAVRRNRFAAVVLAVVAGVTVLNGAEFVLYVVVAEEQLGLGSEGLGYLYASIGAGGFVAAVLTDRITRGGQPVRPLVLAVMLAGLPVMLLAFTPSAAVAFALLAVSGGAGLLAQVMAVTLLQRTLPGDVLGRVFGLLGSAAFAAMLLGAGVAPPLIEASGTRGSLLVFGAVPVATALVAYPVLARLGARAAARAGELEPVVDVLAGLRIFEGLGRPVLEGLAAASTRENVPAGDDLIRAGDPADDLFVIEAGKFDVWAPRPDGEERVAEVGPGAYVGEIGLLEHIPRTATVRAVTAGRVLRITGEDFLSAVQAVPPVALQLRVGMVQRLAHTDPSLLRVAGGAGDTTSPRPRPDERRS